MVVLVDAYVVVLSQALDGEDLDDWE